MNLEFSEHLREHDSGTLDLIHTMENFLFIVNFSGDILVASDSFFEKTNLDRKYIYTKK